MISTPGSWGPSLSPSERKALDPGATRPWSRWPALNRRWLGLVAATLLLAGAMYIAQEFGNQLEIGSIHNDDSRYAVLATSLATGRGYRLVNLPEAPAETAYPPFYPLFLALIRLLLPHSFAALKTGSVLLTLAVLLLLALELRHARKGLAWIVLLLFALHPQVVLFATMALSEPLFLLLILLAFRRIRLYFAGRPLQWFPLITASVVIALAYLTRFVGIVLIPTTFLYGCLQRKGRQALVLIAAAVILCLPWTIRNHGLTGHLFLPEQEEVWASGRVESSQDASLRPDATLTGRFRLFENNAVTYLTELIPTTVGRVLSSSWLERVAESGRMKGILTLLRLSVPGLILLGITSRWRASRTVDLPEILSLLYVPGIMLWPYVQQGRFLYPVLPFLLLYFYVGVDAVAAPIVGRLFKNRAKAAVAAALAAITLILLIPNLREDIRRAWTDPIARYTPRIAPAGVWLAQHTPANAVVMAEYPSWLYLYSGRRTRPLTGSTPCNLEDVVASDADYIVVGPAQQWSVQPAPSAFATECLLPALARERNRYELLFSSEGRALWVFRNQRQAEDE